MSTVDESEIERFTRIAGQWWDPRGKFKPLHVIGPLRITYIRNHAAAHFSLNAAAEKPLAGLKLLDIGCGGGLIAEPMSRLGASVTGIDAGAENINVAKLHAEQARAQVDYRCTTAEDLRTEGALYDVVLALEIIEHVANVDAFMDAVMGLLKPGGLLIMSTLNRTPKSFALAIVGAEYVLRWLPRGTHTWGKFLKPSELERAIARRGGRVIDLTGMVMHPLTFEWSLTPKDLAVNYLLTAVK